MERPNPKHKSGSNTYHGTRYLPIEGGERHESRHGNHTQSRTGQPVLRLVKEVIQRKEVSSDYQTNSGWYERRFAGGDEYHYDQTNCDPLNNIDKIEAATPILRQPPRASFERRGAHPKGEQRRDRRH